MKEPLENSLVRGESQPSPGNGPVVLAFGGVVWERSDDGGVRLAVVHRPSHEDWSFPKGKVDPGELAEETARREVEEETGILCSLGRYLGELSYALEDGSTKVVGYWSMQPVSRRPRPPDREIDVVAWWSSEQAAERLTHAQDRELLARFLALVPEAAPDAPR